MGRKKEERSFSFSFPLLGEGGLAVFPCNFAREFLMNSCPLGWRRSNPCITEGSVIGYPLLKKSNLAGNWNWNWNITRRKGHSEEERNRPGKTSWGSEKLLPTRKVGKEGSQEKIDLYLFCRGKNHDFFENHEM